MLTDDHLTHELGAAFRADTSDLTYGGRRRPRTTLVVALPATAVAVTVAAVAVNALVVAGSPAPRASAGPGPVSTSTPSATPVTEKLDLAGFTVTYQRTPGQPAPLYAEAIEGGLPDGVTPVPLTGTDAKAWAGKEPKTGENAVYVLAPTRNGGNLFALVSAVYTQDELVDFLKNGTPKAVPLVKR